jgi:DNA-binding SARP family transcriptional activator
LESSARRIPRTADVLHVALLSGFNLHRRGQFLPLQAHAQRLVALLALESRPVHRLYISGKLWPDAGEDRAGASLRTTLWRLGRVADDLVAVTGSTVGLAQDVDVDVRRASDRARTLIDRPEDYCHDDVDLLGAHGELLPDWYDDWVLIERERFRELRLRALEGLARALTAAGAYGEAIRAGLAAVSTDPLRESAQRAVVRTYLVEGNAAEALRRYESYRRQLREAVGLDPSQRMEMLIAPLRAVRSR